MNDDDHPILRQEVEAGIRARKSGKAAAINNIQTELRKHGAQKSGQHLGRSPSLSHRLVGLVVKASASRAEDPGFESRLRRDFFGVESYQ